MTDSRDASAPGPRAGRIGSGLLWIAALAAGGTLAGQGSVLQNTLVAPPSHATTEGTASTNVPFGRLGPVRAQLAYDATLFAGAVVVTELALRTDGGVASSAKSVDLEVRLSTMSIPLTSLQASFALNRGADETVVFDRKTVQLPALPAAGTPSPFGLRIPLDRSFAYDPARGALLVELVVHRQDPGAFPLDATHLCNSPFVRYGPAGCPAGGPLDLAVPTAQVTWGRPAFVEIRDARPGAPTWLVFGSIETGVWNGVPIPLDLTPFGAPGCHIAIDPLAILPATADGTGVASFRLSIPAAPQLQSEWVRMQALALDPTANALGVTASQPGKVQICGWEAVGRVFASSLTAVWGYRELGVAPVVELVVQ